MAKIAEKKAVKTQGVDTVNSLESLVTIDQNARAFNRSANRDKKLNKFIDGDFTPPTIFRDDNFKKFVEGNKHILEANNKRAMLDKIVAAKIDEEVAMKIATFNELPLTKEAKADLNAASSEYKQYLANLATKAKAMLNELQKVK